MLLQPGLNLRMFVSTVIVHHEMQRYLAGKLLIQTSQKFQKLPIAMPGEALTDHFALGPIDRIRLLSLLLGPRYRQLSEWLRGKYDLIV